MGKRISDYRKCTKYKEIKQDLLNKLKEKGEKGTAYINLIDDYMELWVTKSKLNDDITDRGVTVMYNNGGGQVGYKKNDSVELSIKVNSQMLKILNELEIKPAQSGGEDDDKL